MEVTEAPSGHRATEHVCQFYQQFIHKAFTSKQLSRIRTLQLRRYLCNIALFSVPSVTLCALYVRVLVYHSIFRKDLFYYSVLLYCKDNSNIENCKGVNYLSINALLACKRCPLSPLLTSFWYLIKHLFCIAFVTN